MSPFSIAIELCEELIDQVSEDPTRHFGAIGTSNFERVRFYSVEQFRGVFNYDEAKELAPTLSDTIEIHLMRVTHTYSLLGPLVAKLRSVAPAFNANGKIVFLGSWGMGPCEIGRLIRSINERAVFREYLRHVGVSEDHVDAQHHLSLL